MEYYKYTRHISVTALLFSFVESIYFQGLSIPEIQYHIHKGFPETPILSQINPVTHIDTYFFKIQEGLGLPKGLFPVGLSVKIFKVLLPFSNLATFPAIHPDYIK